MGERYFTPAEVNALIPALSEIVADLQAAHREAARVREEVRAEQARVALAGGALVDGERWRSRRQRLEALTARLEAGLARIAGLGGVTKDLELGLVDFPHLREGRVVNLCWKYGEPAVGFWHGLDEGYAARKPL